MSDAERSWWLEADRTWRRGAPPDGWRQGSDGRWNAPGSGPDHTTDELVVVAAPWTDPPELPTQDLPAVPARHLAITGDAGRRHGQPRSNAPKAVLGPTWTKVATSALAAVVLLTAAGAYAAARRTNGEPADELSAPAASSPADQPATTASTDPEAAPSSGDRASEGSAADPPVTTTAPPSPTTNSTPPDEPDPAAPGDPLAACSAGQRSMIERGNHPWEWYLARFDANGDGVLCN